MKIKQAPGETSNLISPLDISQLGGNMSLNLNIWNQYEHLIDIYINNFKFQLIGYIKSEKPNNSLYTYDGLLIMSGPDGQKQVPLDPTQLLLRVSLIFWLSVIYYVF